MIVGQYVYVKDGVHDERMTEERCGLIIGFAGDGDQPWIWFPNNQILKFHDSQLETVAEYLMRHSVTGSL